MKPEEYIQKLSPELQEKVRLCKSTEEILELARKEQAELPSETLAAIAGGESGNPKNCGKVKCPKCGSTNVKILRETFDITEYKCQDCGDRFQVFHPT